jgi:membrane fusion protein (multidrug efflux system)
MKRKSNIAIAILIVLVALGGLAGVKVMQIKTLIAAGKAYVPPPETVSTFVAREENWPSTLSAIGSIVAAQGVTIAPELAGTVREIGFESGAVVAKGDLLVRLDTSTEDAQLRAIEAQRDLDRINLTRMQNLRKENTISQSELDSAEIAAKQSQANADNIHATIEKKTIRAPFAGRTGIRQINLGESIDHGNAIVSLQSLAPVYGNFSLPQQDLALVQTGMKVQVVTDTYPGRQFEGTVSAINPDLDPVTRSVRIQATFENADQLLRPGMFARMEVVLPEEKPALAIPGTSILSAPYGDSVYVVTTAPATNGVAEHLVVRQQFVRVNRSHGDFVSIETGLKPGDRVVSSGIFKLRNGMSVVENNDIVPKSGNAPKPSDS